MPLPCLCDGSERPHKVPAVYSGQLFSKQMGMLPVFLRALSHGAWRAGLSGERSCVACETAGGTWGLVLLTCASHVPFLHLLAPSQSRGLLWQHAHPLWHWKLSVSVGSLRRHSHRLASANPVQQAQDRVRSRCVQPQAARLSEPALLQRVRLLRHHRRVLYTRCGLSSVLRVRGLTLHGLGSCGTGKPVNLGDFCVPFAACRTVTSAQFCWVGTVHDRWSPRPTCTPSPACKYCQMHPRE